MYLALIRLRHPGKEVLQYVLYRSKKEPIHIGQPIKSTQYHFAYETIRLNQIPFEKFTELTDVVSYAFSAGSVKNEDQLNTFWANLVKKKNAQNQETFTLALAVAEGLMEKHFTQTFKTMINFKRPVRSKILDSLIKEVKEEAKAEARKELYGEAKEEVKAEVQEELVMRCLNMGMSIGHNTEITGLTEEAVASIAQRTDLQ